jgi:hypothetical protein
MRLGVLLFGLGLVVITGACNGPGASDDECTATGNVCVDLTSPHHPVCLESYPYSCQASGSAFVCCRSPDLEAGTGSGGTSGSGGTAGSGTDSGKD